MTEDSNLGTMVLAVVIFLAAFFLYFLPTLLAVSFRRRQAGAIFILNFLLGWTVIGWAGAMVWVFVKERE